MTEHILALSLKIYGCCLAEITAIQDQLFITLVWSRELHITESGCAEHNDKMGNKRKIECLYGHNEEQV